MSAYNYCFICVKVILTIVMLFVLKFETVVMIVTFLEINFNLLKIKINAINTKKNLINTNKFLFDRKNYELYQRLN